MNIIKNHCYNMEALGDAIVGWIKLEKRNKFSTQSCRPKQLPNCLCNIVYITNIKMSVTNCTNGYESSTDNCLLYGEIHPPNLCHFSLWQKIINVEERHGVKKLLRITHHTGKNWPEMHQSPHHKRWKTQNFKITTSHHPQSRISSQRSLRLNPSRQSSSAKC